MRVCVSLQRVRMTRENIDSNTDNFAKIFSECYVCTCKYFHQVAHKREIPIQLLRVKKKKVESDSCSEVSNALQLHGLQLPKLLCPWGFSRQEYWSGLSCLPLGYLPNPWIESRPSALQVDSLPTEPPGKPKYTIVGGLSLLRGSSQPRNQTGVSCTAGRFFTN